MGLVKEEIMLRLKMLQELHGLVEYAVESNETIYCSGTFNVYGKQELGCVPAEHIRLNDKPLLKFVEEYENTFKGNKVYHIIVGGPFINLLYISRYREDWVYDRPDKYNVQAYVINVPIPEYSEPGRIAIKGENGVLLRIE